MRLLFISNVFPTPPQPTKGVFNLYLVQALARHHDVRVVCPLPWLSRGGRATPDSVPPDLPVSYPRFYYPPKLLRRWYGQFMWYSVRRTVHQHLREQRPDAVVGYWAHPDGEVALRAAREAGTPAVVIVGGSDVLLLTRNPNRRRCVVNVLSRADAVVTVGQNLKEKIVSFGIPAGKVHVIPRGVDPERFQPGDRDQARARVGVPAEGDVLLWVGRMAQVKGLDVLLKACDGLRRRGRCFHLYLVGEGPLRRTLASAVAARGLGGCVSMVGPVAHAELPDWYRAADLTVLPSLSEGVPNVLRESLACGTPVVASRVGGVPEIISGPVNRLVPPGDPAALEEELAQALAERAQKGSCRFPSPTCAESAEALLGVIRPLLAPAGAPPPVRPRPTLASRLGVATWRALLGLLPRRLLLRSGPADSGRVCLTFDDGPHPEHTPRLLDALKAHRVRASFFVIGAQAERHPELVRRMAADGHLVLNHSFSHSDPHRTSARELLAEVHQTNDLLGQLVGATLPLARPPRGQLTALKLWFLWRAGQTVVLWNVDPKDYARSSGEEVRAWFRARPLRAGDVVLLHDRFPYAAEILPDLAAAAREQGLDFATVAEFTGVGAAARPTSRVELPTA